MAEPIVYWLSYRLKDSGGYERTYEERETKLHDEIRQSCGNSNKWWYETTSFFIFKTSEAIDTISARVKRAIAAEADIVVVRQMDSKVGRVIGKCADADIFDLVPYMKKA
jgi:hypothetical protein